MVNLLDGEVHVTLVGFLVKLHLGDDEESAIVGVVSRPLLVAFQLKESDT